MDDPLLSTPITGHGPLRLIAVHGWMADARLFDPLRPLLDPARYSLACMDCRGYGRRRAVPGQFDIEEIAFDTARLARALGWDSYHVLGHSMAGMAAQWLMLQDAGLASALLLSPVPAGGAVLDAARRSLLGQALRDPEMRLQLIDSNTGGRRDADWLRALRDDSLAGTDPGVMGAYLDSWSGPGFAAALRGPRCPATVVLGALDPGTPEARMRAVFDDLLPGSRLTLLPDTGHYAMRESPAALLAAIDTHFDRLG